MVTPFVAGDRIMNGAGAVLFRRLLYMLSPQLDIYENLGPLAEGKRVLEIGFGTGTGILQYISKAELVHAVEIDPSAIRFAKRCFPIKNIIWLEADITQWRNEGAYWDFIVMIEVLEHVRSPKDALINIRAKLAIGGYALITVPNKNRERKKDDPLIEHEWDAEEFLTELLGHFDNVSFLDYELGAYTEFPDATATPLIALCS